MKFLTLNSDLVIVLAPLVHDFLASPSQAHCRFFSSYIQVWSLSNFPPSPCVDFDSIGGSCFLDNANSTFTTVEP